MAAGEPGREVNPGVARLAGSPVLAWVRGLIVVPGAIALVLALIGPWVAPEPLGASVGPPFQPPSAEHLFGTDRLGRDVWSQALHGGRAMLVIPAVATALTMVVGVALGMTMGYRRGALDSIALPALDLLLVLPGVLVVLVLASSWGGGALVIIVTMLLTGAPFLARVARAGTMQVSQAPFVQISLAQGDSTAVVLWRDILPNIAGPLLADAGIRFIGALYLVAALSLLGFGPPSPQTDWAVMLSENAEGAGLNIWGLLLPTLLLAALAVSVNVTLQSLSDRMAR